MNFPRQICALSVAWLLSAPAPALAQVPQSAISAYARGDYLQSAILAEKAGDADALAFAARAYAADGMIRERACVRCFQNSERAARAAIDKDATIAEAYVQLAIALGFRGRLLDAVDAQSEGLAEAGREAIDKALDLKPADPWALAILGGWHLEIVSRGGAVLASVMFDASEKAGMRYFREALSMSPYNLLIHYHYALALLALDEYRFGDEAQSALRDGLQDKDASRLGQIIRARSARLLQSLRLGKADEVKNLVRRFQFQASE